MLTRRPSHVVQPVMATAAALAVMFSVGCGSGDSPGSLDASTGASPDVTSVATNPAGASSGASGASGASDALDAGPPLTAAPPAEPTPGGAPPPGEDGRVGGSSAVVGNRQATGATAPPLATTPTGRPDGPNAPSGTSPSSSPTPAQTRSRIDEALAARDLCELYDALADLEVSGKTVREFRQGMLVVLGAVRSAQSFVPEDIATSWATLVAQTERVVEVLGESNATVSSAASVFQDSTYRDAMDRTDQWMGDSCAG